MTRRRLSVDAIVAATLEIGLDTATTGSVARKLGVEQPALYRHVDSKAALFDLAATRALQGLEDWCAGPSPNESLVGFQRMLWSHLDAHRGLAGYLIASTEIPAPLQSAAERLALALATSDRVTAREAILIVDAAVHLTCLTYAGSDRLREPETARRWHERSRQLDEAELLPVLEVIERTDPLTLAVEQLALLTRGLLGPSQTAPHDH